ncbi:aldo/keto reductase [Pantoea sp. BAV 3049]|uniref:aldo/keto reductase n=1 Tax=Pantoea sp. BAV 3049 TaxID=2654188 RepID=UPI001E3E97C3|nr:aldo/keto reductase [Pantoea sp. BAV 3049]
MLLTQLNEIAAGYSSTSAQIALAWVLTKGQHIVPIPGASKITHLEDNCCAAYSELRAGGN